MIKCAFDAFWSALQAPLNVMKKGAMKPSLPVTGNLSCSYCAAK